MVSMISFVFGIGTDKLAIVFMLKSLSLSEKNPKTYDIYGCVNEKQPSFSDYHFF